MAGRRAPLRRGKCAKSAVKVKGYSVTKKIKKKGSRKKVTIKYKVASYCRKKAKAAKKSRKKAGSRAAGRAAFACQSRKTARFTSKKASGACRKGSKRVSMR